MENDQNDRSASDVNRDGQVNQEFKKIQDNRELNSSPHDIQPRALRPDEDPAIINPAELATFPKQEKRDPNVDIDAERDSHLVNKKHSPVREGRNIISTDNNPDRDGFM